MNQISEKKYNQENKTINDYSNITNNNNNNLNDENNIINNINNQKKNCYIPYYCLFYRNLFLLLSL